MRNQKIATTFGGAAFKKESQVYQEAILIGKTLAKLGYIVKCGGYYGLMEGIAKGVNEEKGMSIGVTNASFDPRKANEYISKENKRDDIFDRLRELIIESDIFIIQYGNLGTLSELFLVWCLCYTKTIKDKKIYLVGDKWNNIINSLKILPIKETEFKHLMILSSAEQLIDELISTQSSSPPPA